MPWKNYVVCKVLREPRKSEHRKSKRTLKIWKGLERQKSFFKLIRTSKVKNLSKDQNVESVLRWLVDQNVENQNVRKEPQKSKLSKKIFNNLFWRPPGFNVAEEKEQCRN
jgi:hypothetical protein